MSCLTEIGLSRNQRVFITLESACGTLQFPNATTDFVRPAGNAIMNQNPAFVDSEELQNTLDILDQFQNAMPAGEWEIPMYVRPTSDYGTPQGDALFRSLQGNLVTGTAASVATGFDCADTILQYAANSGTANFPEKGVIEVNSLAGAHEIYYGAKTFNATLGTGQFQTLSTSYRGTTCATASGATAFSGGTVITLVSRFYDQDTSSPGFSLWIETDHFVQGLSGCSVNNAVLGVNNEGAVTMNFTGQGMEMVWAGETTTSASLATGKNHIEVANGNLFSAGARVWNETENDSNGATSGFIISVARATGLEFSNVIGIDWKVGDIIRGYLPVGTTIGTPIESRLSDLYIDNTLTKFKGGDFTFDVPKNYLIDEVGTDFAEEYLEGVRSITSTLNLYFKKTDAEYFTDGYTGNYKALLLRFGSIEGAIMEIYMKRCKLEVPTIAFAAPAVELNIPMKALGTQGEDSCEINFV